MYILALHFISYTALSSPLTYFLITVVKLNEPFFEIRPHFLRPGYNIVSFYVANDLIAILHLTLPLK